jgi:ligand-binding sensor domain-containing protein
VKYDDQSKLLVIAYRNANIDLVDENHNIINIPDIKIKPVIGSKAIHKILFINKNAYLSCGFGIVVLDLIKKEIKDTYIIGENGTTLEVNDLFSDDTTFYAATTKGIYKALISSPNLANFEYWHKYTNINTPNAKFNAIVKVRNKLFTNKSTDLYSNDTLYYYDGNKWQYMDSANSIIKYNLKQYNDLLYVLCEWGTYVFVDEDSLISGFGNTSPKDIIMDDQGLLWAADLHRGLIRLADNQQNYSFYTPNGPLSPNVVAMYAANGNLWVAPGGYELSTWASTYNKEGLFTFIDEKWNVINYTNNPGIDTIFDFISIIVDPFDGKKVYAGSWGRGLVELYDSKVVQVYNEKNSPLTVPPAFGTYYWIGVGGLCFDDQQNLWVTNMNLGSGQVLLVKKINGDWKKFDLGNELSSSTATRLIIDKNNQKWVMLSRSGGIVVFNDNNTIDNTADDKTKVLTTEIGKGKLLSPNVISFAVDLDGKVWVGTDKGLCVFYTPENIFTSQNFDSQEILVEQDGHVRPLLEGEFITSIVVDGANRKWIGTLNSGVFLMSADGTEEIYNFNTENSPLISNTINCIAINGETGEVFLGTANGIVSFKGTSTDGQEDYEHIFAYPNPVREDYQGVIAIKGLVTNAIVKITDINGNLIYETIAEGGQAVWNGKNYNGEKAHTGVYLVFCTNDDGSKTEVTKILIIN